MKKLIYVSQLDKQGLDVKSGGGKWKLNVVGGSKFKPVRGFADGGSTGRVPGTISKSRWVLKTKIPKEEKCSLGNSLQNVESGINSRCISGAGGSYKQVEIENG
ncbi:hypothetical protein Hanom_Chr08g00708031 [Helianthus anomalus]